MENHLIEFGAYAFSLFLIAGYHLYVRLRLRRDSSYTIQAVNNDARAAWVENIMSDKNNGVLAVQTLRNSTMAATFLASTAVLLIMGVLNLMQKDAAPGNGVLQTLQDSIFAGGDMHEFRLLILLATFFFAFFSFSMAIRMYNHVGYLINSSNAKFQPTPQYVSRLLNRSGSYYSMGMRSYYISVPMVFALFNIHYMMLATIALIFALYHIDRAPDAKAGTGDIKNRWFIPELRFRAARANRNRSKASAARRDVSGGQDNAQPAQERAIANG